MTKPFLNTVVMIKRSALVPWVGVVVTVFLLFSASLAASAASTSDSRRSDSVTHTDSEGPGAAATVTVTPTFPIVINTWPWTAATERAWQVFSTPSSSSACEGVACALDAVQAGCQKCQELQCDGTVGFGGSPDTTGETTLDAMIMDGTSISVGAVGDLRYIKDAVGVARAVMEHTKHTFLAGESAAAFAVEMGFVRTNLSTPHSEEIYTKWRASQCQPNYWRNVVPDPTKSCGPYSKMSQSSFHHSAPPASDDISKTNHDTIAMLAIDPSGKHIVSATSTNGANHKIAGRVGDSPVMGAGSYADSSAGACGATGDGDVMMRFLPCFAVVESMRNGASPKDATEAALRRIAKYYPTFQGALIAINTKGEHSAAGYGWTFQYSVRTPAMNNATVVTVQPISG
jgi:N4-(beta-N-acetylglucosaminyl)-L-asparaginase